ncbi:MAG: AAA family ATPase, partial [Bacteroidales bacterium]
MFNLYALKISNYKSFGFDTQELIFQSNKIVLIGKNNAGKTNIITALDILIGSRHPKYINIDENAFNDITKPITIELTILSTDINDIYLIASAAKKHQDKFYSDFKKDKNPTIKFSFSQSVKKEINESEDEPEDKTEKFFIEIAGLKVYQKIAEIRSQIIKQITAIPTRNAKDDLTASTWTSYGNLMKSVLENSPAYPQISTALNNLNNLLLTALENERKDLLNTSQTLTFIDDLKFQITKENKPSELLRNLEIFVSENGIFNHIDTVGTGTQSAIIIGILELALKYKTTNTKCFVIEEPEIFLHPLGIRYLGQLFGNYSAHKINQIILTTHSPILLSSFHPIEIARIEKVQGKSVIIQLPHDFTDTKNKIERTFNSKNAEMYFADLVLLVEGESDEIMLNRISEKVINKKGESLNFLKKGVSVVDIKGKANITSFIKILDSFKIKYKAVLDNDFLSVRNHYETLCDYLGINTQQDINTIRKELFSKG